MENLALFQDLNVRFATGAANLWCQTAANLWCHYHW